MKTVKAVVFVSLMAIASLGFVCTSSQQQKAAKLADAYATGLKGVHDTVDAACQPSGGICQGNLISQAEYTAALNVLLKANQAGADLNAAIRQSIASPTTAGAVNAAITAAKAALADGTLGIKNQATAQKVSVLVQSVELTITQIQALCTISASQ